MIFLTTTDPMRSAIPVGKNYTKSFLFVVVYVGMVPALDYIFSIVFICSKIVFQISNNVCELSNLRTSQSVHKLSYNFAPSNEVTCGCSRTLRDKKSAQQYKRGMIIRYFFINLSLNTRTI